MNGTPSSVVALALDPQGLLNGVHPDLVVVGADHGDAVGVENANHSATVAGAVTALFNYGVPSIAVSSESGSAADLATSAQFVASLVTHLQATQGTSSSILPEGVGLSVNVPTGANAGNFAFTTIDGATDHDLSVAGSATQAEYVYGGAISSTNPHSEGDAFNAGQITVSPIDGNTAVRGSDAYDSLAHIVGTTYGTPTHAPATIALQVSEDAFQGDAQFIVTVNGEQIGGVQTVTASHVAGQSQTVTLLDFFDTDIHTVGVQYVNDLWGGSATADRNLYVDKLILNGQVYEGQNAATDTGLHLPNEALLYQNGSVQFSTTQDTLTFRVAEDAYQGDAQFVVLVNGQQVGGTQTVTASHAAGQYQDITLSGNYGDVQSVALQYVNDVWGGSATAGRNLYVQNLTVNGHAVDATQATNDTGLQLAKEAFLYQNGTLYFDHLMA